MSAENQSPEPESPFFKAWAEFVVNNRWVAVSITLVMTALSMWAIYPAPETDLSIEAFLASGSDELRLLEEYRSVFGRDDVFLVVAEAKEDGGVFKAPFLDKLKAVHDELATMDMKIDSLGQCVSSRRQRQLAAAGKPIPGKSSPPSVPAAGADTSTNAAPTTNPSEPATDDGFEDEGADDFGDESADFDDFDDSGKAEAGEKGANTQVARGKAEWGDEGGGTIVDEITSLINVRRTRGRAETSPDGRPVTGIEVGELMDPWPAEAALPQLMAEVLGDRNLVGRVVDAKGKYAVVVVRTQCMAETDSERVNDAVLVLLEKHNGDDFRTYLSGAPALVAGLNGIMMSEMRTLFGLAMIFLIIMMAFIFRHPLGVIGPLAVVGFATIWMFGFMSLVGFPLTMLSTILPTFIICVGVGDTVHVMSVYRDFRRRGVENKQAIVHAIAGTAKPVLYTTLTTAVGLLSFRFADIDAIQEMGTAGAIGVFMALLNSLIILPVLLTFHKKGLMGAQPAGNKDLIDRFLSFCVGRSSTKKGRLATLAGGLMVAGIAAFGAFQLSVHHNPLDWMPEDLPTKIAFNKMDENVGGTANIQLLIEPTSERGLKDRELLVGLEKLSEHIKGYVHYDGSKGIVTNAMSVVDMVKETNQALNAGKPEFYSLPKGQDTVGEALFLFEQSGPAQLRRMATADLKKSQMTLNVRWLEATSYRKLAAHVQEGIDEFIGDSAVVKSTGAIFTLVSTVGSLIFNLIRSFGMAFLVITILMVFLLRDVRLGIIAMVPNLMPIAMIMGLMAALGIPIDMTNLLIASIAMGLAVDDTIHFLHHFKVHYDMYGSVEGAIKHSTQHSGRALVSTTMILAVGFFVFLAAQLASLRNFGGLIGLTVIIALLVDLMMAPALLRQFYSDKEPVSATPDTSVAA